MAPPTQSSATFEQFHQVISVQELVKEPLTSVPPIYVCPEQDNLVVPDTFASSQALPVIDFNLLVSLDTIGLELDKLHSSSIEWGFFQLVNHGVTGSLLAKLKQDVEDFYALPLEEKMKYKIRPGEAEGYGGLPRRGGRLDWSDRLYMTTNPIQRRKPYLFPELPSSLRNTLEEYISEMQRVAMELLMCMAKALRMEGREIEEMFDDGFQSLRLTYYPPCPEPEHVLGIVGHSDASGLTILNQVNGVNGLQIKKDGVWIPVNILHGALVVNVGDILEMLTNGAYKSVEHRVTTNSMKDRTSIAFFFSPKFEVELGPVTSLLGPNNPPMFKRFFMENYVKDFFSHKLSGKSYLDHFQAITKDVTLPNEKHI